ncbi:MULTISPECIES: tRNA (N6-isopentenyl adenosine(37)-C2)-methylthiotransferase MiaB [unclassified Colwellia]|uniref:tRNA (N6-isopentenyl adenosine(37)-C2)-methylthiotransferase MiaB n=1 Tax=unclassified Colwellia TaxID=196834 RepID=UPI0015F762EA|nr:MULTISPECIES: tRNA (N6-isopentenyl adenosine(37)-C2)-methylthiotransferase MiaB [unclassified Colwellia]MBA6230989.1 tRNA (N6-isopentenyl adenosine(37)-C2)-methylthiotransferase MiaB [Colwellia sp. MB02u-7]MBA6234920.1 tRNA (N6-isopentenyl adenosine(37)-C2)-methylthiotransferase MiaB [Colwellia sp. MB02u-11]MBA6255784.1 tRNA (N6-isopentenyl adenosine(37)-C2)-methylthiotransferase MiaB [Colwellia sp. MB3u-28]MBA6261925.1 tRNA (N6-isopentenyl adenosine(37)-C2)-methylthiotransferase MiaB [Colwe
MSKKLYIKTWGCQMNEYDSQKMAELLDSTHGFVLADEAEDADVILLNTCSIREKAQEKVFHQLGRWKHLKDNKPGLLIGVGGCVASQEGEAIRQRAPYVDMVFGPQTLHRLPEMIQQVTGDHNPVVDVSFPEIEKFDRLPEPKADGASAFVSIMEGCSKYCTFCVVPYTRGEEVSRPLDDVLYEIAQLAAQGVREVNLLGQNVNGYRGITHDDEICRFSELLRLVATVDGIDRVRYTTSHPIEFTDDIIEVYKDVPELVSHLHLPVQSGSDRILTQMKRGHTALEYKSQIRKLKKVRPDICMSSDFIIGFPGETDADFQATMDLIKAVDFDLSFSFIYSARPGTPAADMIDDISDITKKERLQILQDQITHQALRIARQMLNTEQRILVEGPSKKNPMELRGKTENNRTVNFLAPHTVIGQFVDVNITDVYANSLRGELVRQESEMGLRIAHSPQDILANSHHTTSVNNIDDLGVGTFTP